MQVIKPSSFSNVIDPDAKPVDFDQALAKFLLAYVRSTSAGSTTSPAVVIPSTEVER